jgi:hypothetical protein
MNDEKAPNPIGNAPVVASLLVLLLGGLLFLANLFVPFLREPAGATIALSMMAALFVSLVIGVCSSCVRQRSCRRTSCED